MQRGVQPPTFRPAASIASVVVVVLVVIANIWWLSSREPEAEAMDQLARLEAMRADRAAAAFQPPEPEPEPTGPGDRVVSTVDVSARRIAGEAVSLRPRPVERATTLGDGDTLAAALGRLYIHGPTADAVIAAYRVLRDPRRIRPGQRLLARFDDASVIDPAGLRSLVIAPAGSGEGVTISRHRLDKEPQGKRRRKRRRRRRRRRRGRKAREAARLAKATTLPGGHFRYIAKEGGLGGTLHRRVLRCGMAGSLSASLQRCGHGESLTSQVAALVGLRMDLRTDLREGDELRVVFDELIAAGERVRYEHVAALRFSGAKADFTALFWLDGRGRPGWYTPEGESVEPMFVRELADGGRLTSGFGMRMHPILKKMKPHKGIDLAAPTGTPVRAAADGRVILRRRGGAAGLHIRIRHDQGFSSEYFHLSRFARRAVRGARVERGQIVGYVGTTGRSTAPHLHFGVRKGGRHVDPMKVFNTPGQAVPKRRLRAFKRATAPLIELLDAVDDFAGRRPIR